MATSSSNLSVGRDAFAVVPHASTNHPSSARALYVGTAGNVTLVTPAGTVILFTNVPAGAILPVESIRVNAVGTTAAAMVGLV